MNKPEFKLWKPASLDLPRVSAEEMAFLFSQRVADTTSTSPITADRLSPELMPIFVDDFPLFDMIRKVPSNGESHTFQQQTGYSTNTTPPTIAETGTVTDDSNTYLRKTTNIMTLATRRGATIKSMLAGQAAGGPSTTVAARELEGGLRKIAAGAQQELLTYQESDPLSTTATAANGIFDANGINGMRYILQNLAPPENTVTVDIRTAWTDQRVLLAFRKVVNAIWDKGGKVDLAITNSAASEALFQDQMAQVRYIKDASMMQLTPGVNVPAVQTARGLVPVLDVPGNFVGSWIDNTGATYIDIFIVWTETLELPYLGAPEPTVISVPIGTDGQLRELKIPYLLIGFAALAPTYMGRVSLRIK